MSKSSQRMIYQTEATREKILRVAEAMFIDKGFFETQMKDVAQAVGISRASVYRYFEDKGDLGFAVLAMVFERLEPLANQYLQESAASPAMNARERLGRLASSLTIDEGMKAEFTFMAEFDAYFSGNRVPEDFHSQIKGALPLTILARLEEIVAAGAVDGSIRQDLPPDAVVALVMYSLKALREHILLRRSTLVGLDGAQVDALLPNLVTVLIDGLRPVQSD
jgi:AcrR family transcriptional regulator